MTRFPRPGRRTRTIALAVAGGTVFAAAAAALWVRGELDRQLSPQRVALRVSEQLGRDVSVARVDAVFRPDIRIRAEEITIAGGGSADAALIEFRLRPLLLEQRIEVTELHFERPRFVVERTSDGEWEVLLLQRPKTANAQTQLASLPALAADDGEIVFRKRGQPGEPLGPAIRIRRFEQEPLEPGGSAQMRLEVAVGDAGSRLALEDLLIEGRLHIRDGDLYIEEGRVRGEGLRAAGLRIDGFEGDFAYQHETVHIIELELQAYEAAWRSSGDIVLRRPPTFDIHTEGEGASLTGLIADLGGGESKLELEPLDMNAHLGGTWGRPESLGGTGHISIRGGHLPVKSLFQSVLTPLGRLAQRALRIEKSAAMKPTRVDRLFVDWKLVGDAVEIHDLELATDDYRYRATGAVGLDLTAQLDGSVSLTARGMQRMMASVALPLSALPSPLRGVPVSIRGDIRNLRIRAHLERLPRGVLTGLTRAATLPASLVKQGGGLLKRGGDRLLRREQPSDR